MAILDWNTSAFLESYFAAAAQGAILNPLNQRLAVPELSEILADSGARLVLYTGDQAVIEEHGLINMVDRKKDMILTGGENVYSTEVEHALHEHPAVLETAMVGVPDESWGESVRAAVVLKEGRSASAAELIAFCRERIAAYRVPRAIEFLPELPRTGSGKLAKQALRAGRR